MPAGFDKLMTAQQTADVVAWLMTQKSVGDRAGFSFRDRPDRIDIYFGEQRIATYLKDHPRLTRRALVNVTTPSGIQVTRNFPPRKPEDIDPGYNGRRRHHPPDHASRDLARLRRCRWQRLLATAIARSSSTASSNNSKVTKRPAVLPYETNSCETALQQWHGGPRRKNNDGDRRSTQTDDQVVCTEISTLPL